MTRAEKRRKMRKIQKEIMQSELSPENTDMSRSERRKESWRLAREKVIYGQ